MTYLLSSEQAFTESEETRTRLENINQNSVEQSINAKLRSESSNLDAEYPLHFGDYGYSVTSVGVYRKKWKEVLNRSGKWEHCLLFDKSKIVDEVDISDERILVWYEGENDRRTFDEFYIETGEPTGFSGNETLGSGFYLNGKYYMTAETNGYDVYSINISEHGYPLNVISIDKELNVETVYSAPEGTFYIDIMKGLGDYIVIKQSFNLFGDFQLILIRPGSEPITIQDLPNDISIDFTESSLIIVTESKFELGDGTTVEPNKLYEIPLPVTDDEELHAVEIYSGVIKKFMTLAGEVIIVTNDSMSFFVEKKNGKWVSTGERIEIPQSYSIYTSRTNSKLAELIYSFANYNSTIYSYCRTENGSRHWVFGNADDNVTTQRSHTVKSADGTAIEYTVLYHESAIMDGKNPTIIEAYGSFGNEEIASYDIAEHKGWLNREVSGSRHGIYVHAHIRGSGQSPSGEMNLWHQQTMTNKQLLIEDISAIADDLFKRGYTSKEHLGFIGYSAGGLLAANLALNEITRSKFEAVVSAYPLLDMEHYTEWGIGSSWIEEFGTYEDENTRNFCPVNTIKSLDDHTDVSDILVVCGSFDNRTHYNHGRSFVKSARDAGLSFNKVAYIEVDTEHGVSYSLGSNVKTLSYIFEYMRQELA